MTPHLKRLCVRRGYILTRTSAPFFPKNMALKFVYLQKDNRLLNPEGMCKTVH